MGDRFGSPLFLFARDIVQELNHELNFYPNLQGVSESARAKIKISALSFYRDNVWDFSTEYPSLRSRAVTLDFSQVHFGDGNDITMLGHSLGFGFLHFFLLCNIFLDQLISILQSHFIIRFFNAFTWQL